MAPSRHACMQLPWGVSRWRRVAICSDGTTAMQVEISADSIGPSQSAATADGLAVHTSLHRLRAAGAAS